MLKTELYLNEQLKFYLITIYVRFLSYHPPQYVRWDVICLDLVYLIYLTCPSGKEPIDYWSEIGENSSTKDDWTNLLSVIFKMSQSHFFTSQVAKGQCFLFVYTAASLVTASWKAAMHNKPNWGRGEKPIMPFSALLLMRTCCPLLLGNMAEIAASMMQPLLLTSLQWLPVFTITNPTHSYYLFNTEGHWFVMSYSDSPITV